MLYVYIEVPKQIFSVRLGRNMNCVVYRIFRRPQHCGVFLSNKARRDVIHLNVPLRI